MQQTFIMGTDIRVSRFVLGTASLHHIYSLAQRQKLLETAASVGITHFDTSPYYGYGLAECDLGVFLDKQRAAFTVTTKVGLYPFGSPSGHAMTVWGRKALGKLIPAFSLPVVNWQLSRAKTSLEQSLKRLKTDYVDFLFLHEPDLNLLNADEFMRWVETELSRGTVRSWGLAGLANKISPWVQANHPLASVVQTKDSLCNRQADFMLDANRSLQFTYGYLSSKVTPDLVDTPEIILRKALDRNSSGAVIVSTRRADRIAQLGRLAV